MADFMVRFAICNVFISGIIGILLIIKRLLKHSLSNRMQYNLWFLLLGLLAVPFLPIRPLGVLKILSWISVLKSSPATNVEIATEDAKYTNLNGNTDWMNDFALSVNSKATSIAGYLLLGIWIVGILAMLILVIRSALRLRALEKSALPVQSAKVRKLYYRCLEEMGIRRNIPIYSTAFLKSPIIVGLLKPCIYLPIHLISDYNESSMRHMLLHELQHYKHKDAIASFLMNLARVIYWFNPFVWYALKEMRNDKEVACDTSVLNMLDEDTYEDYGNTLINFAEKVSLTPFPFASSLGGNVKQMKRRIINIASYEKPTFAKKLKSMVAFVLTAILLIGLTPILSTQAAESQKYQWDVTTKNISTLDVSKQFGTYEGSFVLYDLENDHWFINDREQAVTRVAPDSTYKIYDSLFALDAGIITPENSQIEWDHTDYPFEAWNEDQTLESAMTSSVNWYFQSLDNQLGKATLQSYVQSIEYGNENINGELTSYWMESTLKISPVEQVELLIALYQNNLPFTPENIQTVKDSICLSYSSGGTFYGKTGTGRIDGQDVNGWFIGFLETPRHTWFFATNIKAEQFATGTNAVEITRAILSDLHIWE